MIANDFHMLKALFAPKLRIGAKQFSVAVELVPRIRAASRTVTDRLDYV
jgi:hypothetical protein